MYMIELERYLFKYVLFFPHDKRAQEVSTDSTDAVVRVDAEQTKSARSLPDLQDDINVFTMMNPPKKTFVLKNYKLTSLLTWPCSSNLKVRREGAVVNEWIREWLNHSLVVARQNFVNKETATRLPKHIMLFRKDAPTADVSHLGHLIRKYNKQRRCVIIVLVMI